MKAKAVSHHAVILLVGASAFNGLLDLVDQLIAIESLLAHRRVRAVDLELL